MRTPEGVVKDKIKALLNQYAEHIYYYMPVPAGYGAQSLDFIGWIKGWPFAIEAKAEKGRLTARQRYTISCMRKGGADVFVIQGDKGLEELEAWLKYASQNPRNGF